jgi:hypothetical protein
MAKRNADRNFEKFSPVGGEIAQALRGDMLNLSSINELVTGL